MQKRNRQGRAGGLVDSQQFRPAVPQPRPSPPSCSLPTPAAPCSPVLGQLAEAHGSGLQALAQLWSDKGRGGLLQHLLVAALRVGTWGAMEAGVSRQPGRLGAEQHACCPPCTSSSASSGGATPGWSTRARGTPPRRRRRHRRFAPRCGARAARTSRQTRLRVGESSAGGFGEPAAGPEAGWVLGLRAGGCRCARLCPCPCGSPKAPQCVPPSPPAARTCVAKGGGALAGGAHKVGCHLLLGAANVDADAAAAACSGGEVQM